MKNGTQRSRQTLNLTVMPALEAGIHANTGPVEIAWMLGSSPSMTGRLGNFFQ